MSKPSFKHIQKLLIANTNKPSKWLSYFGLWIGVSLVLVSLQFYLNLQVILGEQKPNAEGNEFISISKIISNNTMGNVEANSFLQKDITELEAQPFIISAAPLIANQFRVQLSAAGHLGFRTDFFIESLDAKFLGTIPPTFRWQEGDAELPLIISNTFLELFNVFAPSYGLPQFSKETLFNIPLNVICYDALGRSQVFNARIVGTTDRINSVLVPTSFLDWANQTFTTTSQLMTSRVYLEVNDLNNPDFVSFLEKKGYSIQNDKVQFGKVKQILNGVLGSIGAIGVFTLLLSIMLFRFYLQWMLAKNQDSLKLLTTIGYSPKWMVEKLDKAFLPAFVLVVILAGVATTVFQFIFVKTIPLISHDLSLFISIWVIASLVVIFIAIVYANHRTLRRVLYEYSR